MKRDHEYPTKSMWKLKRIIIKQLHVKITWYSLKRPCAGSTKNSFRINIHIESKTTVKWAHLSSTNVRKVVHWHKTALILYPKCNRHPAQNKGRKNVITEVEIMYDSLTSVQWWVLWTDSSLRTGDKMSKLLTKKESGVKHYISPGKLRPGGSISHPHLQYKVYPNACIEGPFE